MLHEIDESTAEAIVRVAEIKACDLIVMTSHGRRGIRRALLGSPDRGGAGEYEYPGSCNPVIPAPRFADSAVRRSAGALIAGFRD